MNPLLSPFDFSFKYVTENVGLPRTFKVTHDVFAGLRVQTRADE